MFAYGCLCIYMYQHIVLCLCIVLFALFLCIVLTILYATNAACTMTCIRLCAQLRAKHHLVRKALVRCERCHDTFGVGISGDVAQPQLMRCHENAKKGAEGVMSHTQCTHARTMHSQLLGEQCIHNCCAKEVKELYILLDMRERKTPHHKNIKFKTEIK